MNANFFNRFEDTLISKIFFYVKDAAITSAHLMDSHHKQLFLRALKSKKITNRSNRLMRQNTKNSILRVTLNPALDSSKLIVRDVTEHTEKK